MPDCSYCGNDCAPNADACPKCGANLKEEREAARKEAQRAPLTKNDIFAHVVYFVVMGAVYLIARFFFM